MNKLAKSYDLHTHTTASDGILSPAELVNKAAQNGVDVLAITDHDSVNAIDIAQKAIADDNLNLTLITGTEISTFWRSNEIHIVGLNFDHKNAALLELLTKQQQARVERAKAIAYKLSRLNIYDAYEKSAIYTNDGSISRAHFARFLVENGHVPDMNRAFKKYLAKSGCAYVQPNWTTIETAVNIIKNAGGKAVLAHPSRYRLTVTKMKTLIQYFKLAGGDAIEVSQSRQTDDDLNLLVKCANDYSLFASIGSDFHGNNAYLDVGQVKPLPDSVTPIWHHF